MHFCVFVVFLIINSASARHLPSDPNVENELPRPRPVPPVTNLPSDPNVKKEPPRPTPGPPITNLHFDPNVQQISPQTTPVLQITNNGTNTTSLELTEGITTSEWIYIGIGIMLTAIICQSICFCLYIRKQPLAKFINTCIKAESYPDELKVGCVPPVHKKVKSSQSPRNVPLITADANSEDRYQREPTRSIANTLRPAEHDHSSSLYEYDCIKEKPKPPPISTLPKRNRPPLPLPDNIRGQKSSTLTAHSTQELLQQRGRQVSTVPSKPPINFNAALQLPSQSPQLRRLPIPVRTPVLKLRGTRDDSSYKIYESLPDLREFRHQPKLPNIHQPLAVINPPTATTTQNVNRLRRMPAHHSNLSINTPPPVLPPKPRGRLGQEHNRNGYPTKPKEIIKNASSHSIYESLPDLREFKHYQKSSIAPPSVFAPAHPIPSSLNRPRMPVTEPDSITTELMNKLKRRAELSSLSTNQNTSPPAIPSKSPVMPPPDLTRIRKYSDDSTDDEEWTIEEIKEINMYNV